MQTGKVKRETNKNYTIYNYLFLFMFFAATSMQACLSESSGGCTAGEMKCEPNSPHTVLVCSSDGQTWEQALCSEHELCYQDSCQPLKCIPDSVRCWDNGVQTCSSDGQTWSNTVPCPDGQVCANGSCGERVCTSGEVRCRSTSLVERCGDAGMAWEPFYSCAQDEVCISGRCVPEQCSDGDKTCGSGVLLVCTSGSWNEQPCGEDESCLFDMCLECLDDGDCAPGYACIGGQCAESQPSIVTSPLPRAVIGQWYTALLDVSGGLPPYTWSATGLPDGMSLTVDGTLQGMPSQVGSWIFSTSVTDSRGSMDDATLLLEVMEEGPVTIITASLPEGQTDEEYDAKIVATGGLQPYAWQFLQGTLPEGLVLLADGTIQGMPTEVGTFPFRIRVVDGSTPPDWDARDLTVTIKAAPLEVYGDQEYNLFFTKVIVLQVLVPYVPYSQELQAKGGLHPYTWSETDAPSGLDLVIHDWGLPDGLTLSPDGVISGTVTDISDAQDIYLPNGTHLKGYFTYVHVVDSQSPPFETTAVYCVPTVPVE